MKRQTLLLAILVLAVAMRPGGRALTTALGGQTAPEEPGKIACVATRDGTADPLPDVQVIVTRDGAAAQPRGGGGQGARAAGPGGAPGGAQAAQRGAPANQLRAATDASGQCLIENLSPGKYIVTAQLEGYFGPSSPGSAPATTVRVNVVVTSGKATDVRFPLIPGGVISGRVVDPRGRPLVDTPVQALRLTFAQDGATALQSYSNRPTDDHGDYRIYRLPPGEYYIAANPRNTAPADPNNARETQVRTFYPGALTPTLGAPITIRGGEEIAGSNIQIRNVSLAKISGRVIHTIPISAFDPPAPRGQRGQPAQTAAQVLANNDPALQPLVDEVNKAQAAAQAAQTAMQDARGRLQEARGLRAGNAQQNAQRALPVAQLQLVPRDRNALIDPNTGSRTVTAQLVLPNDGHFEFPNVPPGSYDLYASLPDYTAYAPQQPPGNGAQGRSFGRVAIDVGDADVNDVTIAVHQGVDIQGRLIVDGHPVAFPNAHIVLQPDDSAVRIPVYQQVGRSEAKIDADGSFTIPVVPEAVYRVSVTLGGTSPAQRGRGAQALDQATIQEIEAQLQRGGNAQELVAAARGRQAAQTEVAVPDAYVADIRHNGGSIFDSVLAIGAGAVNGIDVYVESNAGSIAGTVLGPNQKPAAAAAVVLVPPPARRGNPSLYRTATTDQDGKFTIRGLAPGEFKLFAWQAMNGAPYLNPAFLTAYEERGASASIFAGGQLRAEVPLIPESIQTSGTVVAISSID